MLPSTYYMIRLQLGASQRGCADADVSNIIETKATRRNRRKCENAGCLVAVSVFSMTFSSAQWFGELQFFGFRSDFRLRYHPTWGRAKESSFA